MTKEDIDRRSRNGLRPSPPQHEFAFRPARVLMQDFTGVPAVVDLAAMRDAMQALGGDPKKINSTGAGRSGHRSLGQSSISSATIRRSRKTSMRNIAQNQERYQIPLKWAQGRSIISASCRPAPGILPSGQSRIPVARGLDQEGQGLDRRESCHQRKSLIPIRWSAPTRTPRWSTALSVLGWGVGGIEAEAAMLGQPLSMTAARK